MIVASDQYTRGKDTVGLDLMIIFSRSQGSNSNLILGFVCFSTSNISWIQFKFYRFVALDHIHWGKGHS